MPKTRFAFSFPFLAALAACAPTGSGGGLSNDVQVAATTARMQLLAPQCVRHMRGQPVDAAALAAAGFTEINVLNPAARGFRSGSGRDRVNATFLPNECNIAGPNHIVEGGSLPSAVAAALGEEGLTTSGTGVYSASDLTVRLGYPDTGRGNPNITLRRR